MASDGEGEEDVVCIEVSHLFTIRPEAETRKWEPRRGVGRPELGPKTKRVDAIVCCDYEARTRRLYVGMQSSEVWFWSLRSLESGVGERRRVGSHKGQVTAVHVLQGRDGRSGAGLLVTGSADASLRVWDPAQAGKNAGSCLLQTLVGHGGTVTFVQRTADYLISGSTDRTARLWRAAPGRDQAMYPWYEALGTVVEMDGWVRSLSFGRSYQTPDLGLVFVSDECGNVVRLDISAVVEPELHSVEKYTFTINGRYNEGKGLPLAFRRVHERAITAIRFIPEIHRVAVLSYDNTLTIFNSYTGILERTVKNANGCHFTGLSYEDTYNQVILVDANGFLSIYAFDRADIICTKRLGQEPILGITRREGTSQYAILFTDRVEYWNIDHDIDYAVVPGGHEGPIVALYAIKGGPGAHSEDYRVFSAALDSTVRLWDPYDMACVRVLEEEESEIAALTIFESLGLVVTGHDDGHVRVWNLDLCSTLNMKRHSNTVSAVTVGLIDIGSGNMGERLFSCSFDGTVAVWEVRKEGDIRPHLIARWEAHDGVEVLSILYDPMKRVVLTAGNDNRIRVWSNANFRLLGEHVGHREAVTCMALDANFLFSGSDDCDIRMWDTVPGTGGAMFRSGTHLRTLKGHSQSITGMDVIPLSGHLVSCSMDCSIKVWDYTAGIVLRQYIHHEELRCLALRSDTDEIIVGTEQANILRFPAGEEVGTAASRRAMETAASGRSHLSAGGHRGAIIGSSGLLEGPPVAKPPPKRLSKFSPAGSRHPSRSSSLLSAPRSDSAGALGPAETCFGDLRL